WIALASLDDHAIAHHLGSGLGAKAAGPQQGARRQADEAVAPEALAAHHGFEQEAVLAITAPMRELEVERKWGFEVREGFGHQRNAVVALLGQALEFQFRDHVRSFHRPRAGSLTLRAGRGSRPSSGTGRRLRVG